jgi:DNA polymerase III gamma/tau subunit
MLGLTQDERTLGLIAALLERDVTAALQVIGEAVDAGIDMRTFGRQINAALRLMLLARAGAAPAEADATTRNLAERAELPELLRLTRIFSEVDFAIRNSGFPQLPLELAAVEAVVGPAGTQASSVPPAPPPARAAGEPEPPNDWLSTMGRGAPAASPTPPPVRQPQPSEAFRRQASAPEPATPETGVAANADEFVAAWPRVRTEVKTLDRKVEALLASTDPHSLDDGTLTLVAAYPFHAGKLNEAKTRAVIEDAIARVTGRTVSVTTVLRGEEPSTPPPQGTPPRRTEAPAQEPAPEAVERATEDNRDEDEFIRQFTTIFDAEEIDLNELGDYEEGHRRLG